MYRQSDMERTRAEAFSSAADTACNEWNRLRRTKHWCAMGSHFQLIWKNLKNISDDYHKIADEMAAKEGTEPDENALRDWCHNLRLRLSLVDNQLEQADLDELNRLLGDYGTTEETG